MKINFFYDEKKKVSMRISSLNLGSLDKFKIKKKSKSNQINKVPSILLSKDQNFHAMTLHDFITEIYWW